MSDAINTIIDSEVSKAASVSNDGVSVSRRSMSDLIAAAKFRGANTALENISNGTHWFSGIRMVPPGAGGTRVSDDC